MAAFNTKKTLNGPSALISEIASQVESYFKQPKIRNYHPIHD